MKRILLLAAVLGGLRTAAADELGDILRDVDSLGFMKPVPVTVTGFSGEVDSVLRFDLTFMGFEFVTPDKAKFTIQKNGSDGVGALITDRLRASLYNKAFTGGSTRQQTHALADDIAKAITQKPGLAQSRIAFKARKASYGVGEIYIADYDGFNAQAVTRDDAICAAPSWSGRGMLFYNTYKFGNKCDILSHNLATGVRKVVTHSTGDNMSPAVSPDGRRLALIISKGGSPNLYVCDLDGGNLKQLSKSKEGDSSPCWSPDSRTICFGSRQSGVQQLYTVAADGGEPRRLSVTGARSPSEPDWSPDGKYIVFTATMGNFRIFVAPMDGPLRGKAEEIVEGEDPVWAPNSRAVMFVKNVNHRHVLTLLDVPSKQTKELNKISGDASQPSWTK